jgi:hypothetical protein
MASSVRNSSATLKAAWFGSMIPAAPTRSVSVCAARWPTSSSGALQAKLVMLWCSDTQKRR